METKHQVALMTSANAVVSAPLVALKVHSGIAPRIVINGATIRLDGATRLPPRQGEPL